MNRRWVTVLGVVLLLMAAALAATIGLEDGVDPLLVIQGLLLGSAGLLFVLGGRGPAVGSRGWHWYVGLGDVVLGGYFAVYNPFQTIRGDPGTLEWVLVAAFVVGGISLAVVGLDMMRGGRFVDLSVYETDPRGE